MTDVFISYSRRNLALIEKIDAALTARGKQVWFDKKKEPLEGIPPGSKWWDEIKHGIDNADSFLFVISPESVVSPYCNAEIAHALQQQKRIVTAFYLADATEIATRQSIDAAIDAIDGKQVLPPVVSAPVSNLRLLTRQNWLALSEVQYVSFADGDGFDRSLDELVNALDLDLAWVRTLSQLRQAALIWDANGRDDDYRWGENRLNPVRKTIALKSLELDDVVQDFIESEQRRLYRELCDENTDHQRRREIGDRLSYIGIGDEPAFHGMDVRDGVPDICWLPVEVPDSQRGKPISFNDQYDKVYGEFTLQPFYIAKHQVTYVQFETFLEAEDGFKNPEWWEDFPEKYQPQAMETQRAKLRYNPREGVSWYQSVAFSRWLNDHLHGTPVGSRFGMPAAEPPVLTIGKNAEVRLPTEWEWQWAAQNGAEERSYPWGHWQAGHANTEEAGLSRPVAVGMYPQGAAVCIALDMAGNVKEWCLNDYINPNVIDGYSSGALKVLRGGSFFHDQYHAVCAFRSYGDLGPGYRHFNYGLRLAVAPLKGL